MARRAQLGWLVVALVAASPARADDQNSLTIRAPRPAADGQTRTKVELESRRLEAEHLGDVLRSVPGALALDFGGVLATTTISLRGGTADEAAVLLDGVPLGSPAGGGLDLSLVPAALLSQVLVERGADARLGAAAMSGAIELTPAKSSRALLTAGSLGTFGASASLARDFVTDAAWWRATIALDARRSAGDFVYHRDPTPETAGDDPLVTMRRANNDATIRSVLVRVERRAPEGKLSGFAFGTWTDRGLPGPIFSPTPTARQDEKTLVADLDWRTKTLELPLFARTGFLDATGGDAVTLSGEQTYLDRIRSTAGAAQARRRWPCLAKAARRRARCLRRLTTRRSATRLRTCGRARRACPAPTVRLLSPGPASLPKARLPLPRVPHRQIVPSRRAPTVPITFLWTTRRAPGQHPRSGRIRRPARIRISPTYHQRPRSLQLALATLAGLCITPEPACLSEGRKERDHSASSLASPPGTPGAIMPRVTVGGAAGGPAGQRYRKHGESLY